MLRRRHPARFRRWLWLVPITALAVAAFWLLLVVGLFLEQPGDVSFRLRALAALEKARHFPRDAGRQVRSSLRALSEAPPPAIDRIPQLSLSIAPQHLEKLKRKRDDAVQLYGVLISEPGDEVDGVLQLDGEAPIDVTVRLKGDWADQLALGWSWRVVVTGSAAVLGMRRFSLHRNEARGGHGEALLLDHLRSAGIVAPRYLYVDVTLNQRRLGVMALEEHFGVELLESQGRRDSVIVALDEDRLWRQRLINRLVGESEVADADYVSVTHLDHPFFMPLRVFQSPRVWRSDVLRAHLRQAIGLLRGYEQGEIAADDVFDMELVARHHAILNVWNAHHGLVNHNLRWYYNPITRLLEPVAFDHDMSPACLQEEPIVFREATFVQPRASERFLRAWQEHTEQLRDDLQGGDLLARLRARERELLPVLRTQDPAVAPYPLERLLVRSAALLAQGVAAARARPLDTTPPAELTAQAELAATVETLWVDGPDGPYLEFQNVTRLPVRVTSITCSTRRTRETVRLPAGGIEVPPGGRVRDRVRWPVDHGPADLRRTYRVRSRLSSGGNQQEIEAHRSFPALARARYRAPSREDLLATFPFLRVDGGRLVVPAGEWRVRDDLVVPAGLPLSIEPGATLRFARRARLVARSPVTAVGTPDHPIRLLPRGDGQTWAGLVVLRAGGPSRLEHVEVRGTAPPPDDDWCLTGGVTFYESDLRVARSSFGANGDEDALNVVRAALDMEACAFSRTPSDAIDVDFGSGTVAASSFEDIGGDALDISGTELQARDVRVARAGDKAVSVGERSTLAATGLTVQGADIGLASKDGSAAELRDSSIEGASTAALMTFCKKPEYGPATLVAARVRFADCGELAVAQHGSRIEVDGVVQSTRELDVQRLYRADRSLR